MQSCQETQVRTVVLLPRLAPGPPVSPGGRERKGRQAACSGPSPLPEAVSTASLPRGSSLAIRPWPPRCSEHRSSRCPRHEGVCSLSSLCLLLSVPTRSYCGTNCSYSWDGSPTCPSHCLPSRIRPSFQFLVLKKVSAFCSMFKMLLV